MTPLAPYVSARKIFLTDARAISYAESVMGIIENYRAGDMWAARRRGRTAIS